jgi:2-octaprenyl-6-methoxyphenol hydroxylase
MAGTKTNLRTDILIAGAGYVGLASAVAIKSSAPDLEIQIVDAAPPGAFERDTRASAVAAAAARMLDQLGVWDEILPEAQPINEMIVTDSRASDPVRPTFLTFGGDKEEGEPFAHMVPNVALNRALRRKAKQTGVEILDGAGVSAFEAKPGSVDVSLSEGSGISTRLLVAADGVNSKLRGMAGIKIVHVDYGQSGIVVTVAHERPHNGRAEEHFLPAGPFAILPLKGNRSSLVWTERTKDAQELIASDDLVFEAELERRFGLKLGDIHAEGPRRAFPLGLTLAREFVKPRFALAGDAAHGIHPIAGQGLNLGFKDAAALAETVVEAARLGLDIGSLTVLQRYEQWRRFDTVQMGVTTDVLNRLFSNDSTPLRALRDLGLGIVDRMPRLKDFFINQASGKGARQPRLLRGEGI